MKNEFIQLAHGGGGRLSQKLMEDEILPRFGDGPLETLPDAATIAVGSDHIVYSTDSFVVSPIEFPGGNIGELAVYGTVNDISVAGGKAMWLSLSLIIEEGLPMAVLRKILDSMKTAAEKCAVKIVTGDTKVVHRGQCDKIYINTSGIGTKYDDFNLSRTRITPGDNVLSSGTAGDHGIAVLTSRESLKMGNGPMIDTAPVHNLVAAVRKYGQAVKFMRDPTRGGVAAVLNEMVKDLNFGISLDEKNIPFSMAAKAAAEILGLDLLNSPSEGRLVMICDSSATDKILADWKQLPEGRDASVFGIVTKDSGRVILKTVSGGKRIVGMPSGEMLPRIC